MQVLNNLLPVVKYLGLKCKFGRKKKNGRRVRVQVAGARHRHPPADAHFNHTINNESDVGPDAVESADERTSNCWEGPEKYEAPPTQRAARHLWRADLIKRKKTTGFRISSKNWADETVSATLNISLATHRFSDNSRVVRCRCFWRPLASRPDAPDSHGAFRSDEGAARGGAVSRPSTRDTRGLLVSYTLI